MHIDSIFIFEVGYRLDVIKNFWFDTIYHEHMDSCNSSIKTIIIKNWY